MIQDYNINIDKYEFEYNLGIPTGQVNIIYIQNVKPYITLIEPERNFIKVEIITTSDATFNINTNLPGTQQALFVKDVDSNTYELILKANTHHAFSEIKTAIDYFHIQNISCEIIGANNTDLFINTAGTEIYKEVLDLQYEGLDNMPNFFSRTTRNLIDSINLQDYLIELSEIEYSFDNTDTKNGNPSLFYEDSNVNFTCSGIVNNSYLKSFFGINQDTSNYSYIITISKNTEIIWKGIVNQDSIEELFSPTTDSEQVKFQGLGFLKEFKKYFSTKRIKHPESIVWDTTYGEIIFNETIRLDELLNNYLFKNDFMLIELEDSLKDYKVVKKAGIYKPQSPLLQSPILFKTGYERIYNGSLNENCWSFLNRLCNSMGWNFYYYNNKIYIKNRSSNSTEGYVQILEFDKYKEYTAIKTRPKGYEHILILDGQLYGGEDTGMGSGNTRGNYLYLFTNAGINVKHALPFQSIVWHSTTNSYAYFFGTGYKYLKYGSEDKYILNVEIYEWLQSGNHGGAKYFILQEDILRLDCGDTGDEGWMFNSGENISEYNRNRPKVGYTGINNNDLWFTGNYGNCLYIKKEELYTGNEYLQNYNLYTAGFLFIDNFAKFFNDNNALANKINITYKDIISNPMTTFIINGSDELIGSWAVNSLKINLIDNSSIIELQKKITE